MLLQQVVEPRPGQARHGLGALEVATADGHQLPEVQRFDLHHGHFPDFAQGKQAAFGLLARGQGQGDPRAFEFCGSVAGFRRAFAAKGREVLSGEGRQRRG